MKKICATCYSTVEPKSITKGSIWMELLLWVVCFPIGILYSLWRIASRTKGCPVCGSKDLVPLDSARGKEILARA